MLEKSSKSRIAHEYALRVHGWREHIDTSAVIIQHFHQLDSKERDQSIAPVFSIFLVILLSKFGGIC
jgi:hypothetical protein